MIHLTILVLASGFCPANLQTYEKKMRPGEKLAWSSEARSMKGDSQSWKVAFVACQRKAQVEHLVTFLVMEWNKLPERDVADCRWMCRIRRFTFAVLDGIVCLCSKKFSVEQELEKSHCKNSCNEFKKKSSTAKKMQIEQGDFVLELEGSNKKNRHYEKGLAWNRNYCGKSPYLITYSVCPKYIYGATCSKTCMCQSKHCDVTTGNCLGGDKCHSGFEGPRCDLYDLCRDNPCKNGGECHVREESEEGYACKCNFGFYGDNCESSIEREKVMTKGPIDVRPEDVSSIWRGKNLMFAAFFPVVSHLGCFRPSFEGDHSSPHSFSPTFLLQTNLMNVELCLKHCTGHNFTMAALQKGKECRCSHQHNSLVLVDTKNCHFVCSGNKKQLCGGDTSLHIYSLCPRTFYGLKRCDLRCHCDHDYPCNIVTGKCPGKCASGYEGERCDGRSWSSKTFLTLGGAYLILCFCFLPLIFVGLFVVTGTCLLVSEPVSSH